MRIFEGVWTAIVTPFNEGEIDKDSLKKLVKHQVGSGVRGLVVNGTTGESPTLDKNEVKELVHLCKEFSEGKLKIVVGTGTFCTKKTIENTRRAFEWGIDGVLVVVPYYNRPSQRGLVAHFKSVADNASGPVILYNVPKRTGQHLDFESVMELSKVKNIVGIKEATGDLEVAKQLISSCPKDFLLSSGDDGSCFDFIRLGGRGVISVISNLVPQDISRVVDGLLLGETQRSNEINSLEKKLLRLNEILSVDVNPVPIKYALKMANIISSDEVRRPLIEMSDSLKAKFKQDSMGSEI